MSHRESACPKPISPIQVSPGCRHFVDREGRPLFWLGDTQWDLFRLFEPQTALRILRDRQAKGINVILVMLTGVDSRYAGGTSPPACVNLQGEHPWIDQDPLRPNDKYFRHVDAVIRLGEETLQTFVVGVYHQWHAGLLPPAKARPWAKWVAARYRDVPNLIWCMYPKATEEFAPVCRELAAGLREGDGGAHLITMHPDPAVASSSFLHEEPWLAFNMIQTCLAYDRIHEAVTADRRRTPVKPVVMAEGAYEGLEFNKFQTPLAIRKQAYWSQLAGGYHVYGHNDAWYAPLRWEEWLPAPGSAHLRVFRDTITSLPQWWLLEPDQSLLAFGEGEGMWFNAAARSPDRRWALVYLSGPSTVAVRLDALAAGGPVRAQWIDPRSGDRLPEGAPADRNARPFTCPPGWEDAILLLETS